MSPFARWARLLLVVGATSAAVFSGCEPEQGFECGRAAPDSGTVRTCDRAGEVCVCATNSCAKKVGILPEDRAGDAGADAGLGLAGAAAQAAEWGDCIGPGMTGYRYVESPYARSDLAGTCVRKIDRRLGVLVPTDDDPNRACPGQTTGGASSGGASSGGKASGGAGGEAGAGNGGGGGASGGGGSGGEGGSGGNGGMHEGGAGASGAGTTSAGSGAEAGMSGGATSGSGGMNDAGMSTTAGGT